MNDKEIKKILKEGKPVRVRVDRGLYFRVSNERTGFWVLRYSINEKRREITLGRYGQRADELTLKKAKDEAAIQRAEFNKGLDPVAEKKRPSKASYKTVNDIAQKWLKICERELKNPQIPERVYRKEIAPVIGDLAVTKVEPSDILGIVEKLMIVGDLLLPMML